MAKMSEPSDDEAAMLSEIGREVVTIRQPRVDGIEVECVATDDTKGIVEVVLKGRLGLERLAWWLFQSFLSPSP